MNRKFLIFGAIIFAFVAINATAFFYFFPFQSDQPPRVDDSDSTLSGIEQVVKANNEFAFDLYSQLNNIEDGNIFYSPYSISTALVMTYEGANGTTKNEIQSVFNFPEYDILRSNFAAIYNDINRENRDYELRTGNALWAQFDYSFLNNYTNRVEQYYGGKVTNLDFKEDTENSRQTINTFIEEQTNGKIKNLIPSGTLTQLTRLVLTNAIYFKGEWEVEFDESNTRNENFKISSDNVVKTSMMNLYPEQETFNYVELEKLQILELPYKGDKISMLILLPRQEEVIVRKIIDRRPVENKTVLNYSLNDIELSNEKLKEYKSQMQMTSMDSISFPKFEFDLKYFMKDTLSEMGMPTVFNGADFSRMDGTKNLQIGEVVHQGYIKVDEQGTEAAAATGVSMRQESYTPPTIFKADHPFIFIIQHKDTGNILFLGRVVDPT